MSLLLITDSVNEIEKKLEQQLIRGTRGNRILSDIKLTKEDYDILKSKMNDANISSDYFQYLSKYRLCPLVTWAYGIREFDDIEKIFEHIRQLFETMPQHLSRYVLEMYSDTFNEYGIDYVMERVDSLDELYMMLLLQSGFTAQEIQSLCQSFDEKVTYTMRNVFDSQMPDFSDRVNIIRDYVDSRVIGRVMILLRKLYSEIIKNEYDFDELFRRNKMIPERIICDMYDIIKEKGADYQSEKGKCC